MPTIATPNRKAQKKLFHNEKINVYPTFLPLSKIHYWPQNNRTIFTFERLERLKGKELKDISTDEITQFVAEQDIHKLQILADSIERNGVQIPLIIRNDGKLLDGNRRYFACHLLKMQCVARGEEFPKALSKIPVQVIRKADLKDTLELKILAEANFIPDLKVPWPLDAQARAVDEYYQQFRKAKNADEETALSEIVSVFGISRQRAVDLLGALELTKKFIGEGANDDEMIKRRAIVEDKFVYFWEFLNKAMKGRRAYDATTETVELKEVTNMFFQLMAKGRDNPITNVKQVEPLAQSRRDSTAWGILKESKGGKLSVVVSIMNEKKEVRKAEDKIRVFFAWLKDIKAGDLTPKAKVLLHEVVELAEKKIHRLNAMPSQTIFCPGGATSQSGVAVKERYPDAIIESCGPVPIPFSKLEIENGPFAIPIWNSHEGEVKKATDLWVCIEGQIIKITDSWAKTIDFWFVRRSGPPTAFGKIGSVDVAKTQCSGFFTRMNATLEKCSLTTVAFDDYRKGASWDGVLVAPGQGENEVGYEVMAKQTANPNNFTSFIRFVPSRIFAVNRAEIRSWITGVRMPAFGASLGDAEQTFFDELLGLVKDLKDIPKLVFVFNRDAKVGLLFEGMELHAGDLLDAEQLESDEISIYENAGATVNPYTQELSSLFKQKFPALTQDDFILHSGVSTCLFACPPLGLYTHGYQIKTVEPVVRFYISKLFQLWDDEILKCTPAQAEFFARHKEAWLEKGSEFIQFKIVSATAA